MSQVEELVKALSLQEKEDLHAHLSSLICQEIAESKTANEKKLAGFAKAVRRAGFLKQLKSVRIVRSTKLPVHIVWEYFGKVSELETANQICIGVDIDRPSVDTLEKRFAKEAAIVRKKVYSIFKAVEQVAAEHGVLHLDWENAVPFLWSEC